MDTYTVQLLGLNSELAVEQRVNARNRVIAHMMHLKVLKY